jgi:hypothetical protein
MFLFVFINGKGQGGLRLLTHVGKVKLGLTTEGLL